MAQRRGVLVQAAFELVAKGGWAQLRIERICQAARLNKRYFYESFGDIDAVIEAVMNDLASDLIKVTIAAMDPDTARGYHVGGMNNFFPSSCRRIHIA